MDNKKLLYEGIFFEGETVEMLHGCEKMFIQSDILDSLIAKPILHCTFKYRPNREEIFDEIVGQEIAIEVIGYGFDGKNSGVLVRLPDDMKKYYLNYDQEGTLKKAHITISLGVGAKAVDTAFLDFKPLPTPFIIRGRFGYCIREGKREHISYEPFIEEKII